MNKLVEKLIQEGYLHSDKLIEAFLEVPREQFISEDLVKLAVADISLPIGHGQTISKPLTVAFMLEELAVQKDQHVLDVGSGSGWTTAILAKLVGEKGRITALEIVGNLCEQGKKNVAKFDFIKKSAVEFHCQSAEKGYEKNAPYDRILVSASAEKIPPVLLDQLAVDGTMVLPIKNEIWSVRKKTQKDLEIKKFPGFIFVPLVK